jgi:hypothetical protein
MLNTLAHRARAVLHPDDAHTEMESVKNDVSTPDTISVRFFNHTDETFLQKSQNLWLKLHTYIHTYILTYLLTYLLTHSLHGAGYYLKS